MEHSEIILRAIELILGAVAAFLAILFASKKRSAAVVLFAASVLLSYAKIVYALIYALGIVGGGAVFFSIPILNLFFAIASPTALIFALIFFMRDSN